MLRQLLSDFVKSIRMEDDQITKLARETAKGLKQDYAELREQERFSIVRSLKKEHHLTREEEVLLDFILYTQLYKLEMQDGTKTRTFGGHKRNKIPRQPGIWHM